MKTVVFLLHYYKDAEGDSSICPSTSLHCSNNQNNTKEYNENIIHVYEYNRENAWTPGRPTTSSSQPDPILSDGSDVQANYGHGTEPSKQFLQSITEKLACFFGPDETLTEQRAIYSCIREVMKTTYKRDQIVAQCKMLNVPMVGERLDLLKQKGVIHEKPEGDLVWVGG